MPEPYSNPKTYSDLDLMVMGDERIPDLARAELVADLEESDLPFRVDLRPGGRPSSGSSGAQRIADDAPELANPSPHPAQYSKESP